MKAEHLWSMFNQGAKYQVACDLWALHIYFIRFISHDNTFHSIIELPFAIFMIVVITAQQMSNELWALSTIRTLKH